MKTIRNLKVGVYLNSGRKNLDTLSNLPSLEYQGDFPSAASAERFTKQLLNDSHDYGREYVLAIIDEAGSIGKILYAVSLQWNEETERGEYIIHQKSVFDLLEDSVPPEGRMSADILDNGPDNFRMKVEMEYRNRYAEELMDHIPESLYPYLLRRIGVDQIVGFLRAEGIIEEIGTAKSKIL